MHSDDGGTSRSGRAPAPDLDLVEYVVISVPEMSAVDGVAAALKHLVEAGQIRILDLVAVSVGADGRLAIIEPERLTGLNALDDVEGEVGGLLSEDDLALLGGSLSPGASALLIVVEDRWAHRLADAARGAGGTIIGGERIPRHRLEQSRRTRTARPENGTGQ